MQDCHLSIVIPIYNEKKRIGNTLHQMLDYFSKQTYSRELILVDGGSHDRGIAAASEILQGKEEFRVVSYGSNWCILKCLEKLQWKA